MSSSSSNRAAAGTTSHALPRCGPATPINATVGWLSPASIERPKITLTGSTVTVFSKPNAKPSPFLLIPTANHSSSSSSSSFTFLYIFLSVYCNSLISNLNITFFHLIINIIHLFTIIFLFFSSLSSQINCAC